MFWRNNAICRMGVAAAAAVLLAACSSGGGGTAGSGPSGADPKSNESPITLGMILNSVYVPYVPQGAQAAIAAINAAGGVEH